MNLKKFRLILNDGFSCITTIDIEIFYSVILILVKKVNYLYTVPVSVPNHLDKMMLMN